MPKSTAKKPTPKTIKPKPTKTAAKPTTKTPKGAITGSDVASYVARTWTRGPGPLPLHQGCFFHARRCLESGDRAGALAFIAITPDDFWVDLVRDPGIETGEPLLAPTKAHPELFLDQLVVVAEVVPELRRVAAEAMVKEIARAVKAGSGVGSVGKAMEVLLGFDVKLAVKTIASAKSLSDASILVPFILAMLQAGNLAAAKEATARLTTLDTLLECELSQAHWSALAPSLKKAGQEVLGTKQVPAIVEYIARYARNGSASLLGKEPSASLARMQWDAGHQAVACKTLASVDDGEPHLVTRYQLGLLSTAKLIEEAGKSSSSASAWRALSNAREHASPQDRKAVDNARAAAVKRGPAISYDTGVWTEIQLGEAALAVESSDDAKLAAAVTNLETMLETTPPDKRSSNLHMIVKRLLARGLTDAAVRVASLASNRPIVANETVREMAILGFLPHDPPGALGALAKLAPPKVTYAAFAGYGGPSNRCEYRRNEWALRILEAIAPRA